MTTLTVASERRTPRESRAPRETCHDVGHTSGVALSCYEHVMSHPCHTTARLDDGHDAGTYVVVRVPRVYACG